MNQFKALQNSLYSPQYEHDACGIGFIVNMKGLRSHQIIDQALTALQNLEHRGARGSEENSGDGAGITIQIPHEFFWREASLLGFSLPELGEYGAGLVFLPQNLVEQNEVELLFEKIVHAQGQKVLGWRQVPYDASMIGSSAKDCMPAFKHVFIGMGEKGPGLPGHTQDAFERRLCIIRKSFEQAVKKSNFKAKGKIYIPSLSTRILIYKGMLIAHQMRDFFLDLRSSHLLSALAVFHSRFSTNTFPSWELAQPFRYLSHNGEINTLRGNINRMRAREALLKSPLFEDEIQKIIPVIREGSSDSATFDNVLEMLVMGGYSLPEAIMIMIPEAWSAHATMSQEKKSFYQYFSCLMEPWDGPASMAFTDGQVIGAVLDRNGLRPSRYYVTKDDIVIMASEVGVLDKIPAEDIVIKGRLQPGRMFFIDLNQGRIVEDTEIKNLIVSKRPYHQWLKKEMINITDLPTPRQLPPPDHQTVIHRQTMYGYTEEDVNLILIPMARDGQEPLGCMGTDTPLAALTEKSPNLYGYFKQLFAQVTNPPLDAIREELVTSVDTTIGSEQNLLDPQSKNCHHIRLVNPIIDNENMARLKRLATKPYKGFKSCILPIIFPVKEGVDGMKRAIDELFNKASKAIKDGANILILSDRGVSEKLAPIPSLLVSAGLHHHLVREGTRTRAGLVLESGAPREVHQYCLLIGYGVGAINPYLAFETIDDLIRDKMIQKIDRRTAIENYRQAVKKGLVKVISKVGISTIQSYRGAQIFEAIGLNREVIDKFFTNTPSRIEGIGLDEICEEALTRHTKAYPKRISVGSSLDVGGEYKWRLNGVPHLFNPDTIAKLQHSTQTNNYQIYKDYARLINDQSLNLSTLRGLMKFKKRNPIPLSEVEPVEKIFKRFKTGAMSYGSISAEAHESLAIAMNRIGGKSNTGEGGEDPARWIADENGDLRRSAIKQVASGRFGVTSAYLVNADEIQIKMAQGAKPGEGGQLPGNKVWPWIAKVRYSTPGVGLISPPPHHDIYSIEDLAQLIFDLKNANPRARINVKLVAEVGVGTVAAGVAKAHADTVLISGYDGGTGASPLTSIKHAGIPWELGLAETQQTLVANNLRGRIRVEVDGQLKTGRDVAIACLLGAEEFGFATAPLVTLGCVMMRVCHLDTCPTGIATQNPTLRKKFIGKPEYVIRFFNFVAEELREVMAELGFRSMKEMIGRADCLDFNDTIAHWKAKKLDFSPIFHRSSFGKNIPIHHTSSQDHALEHVLDNQLIHRCRDALEYKTPVEIKLPINNRNRTVGTMLGSALTRNHGADGLKDDTIQIKLNGSAGQSLGAFLPKGITLTVEGDANDYVGKGLSGGKIIIYPVKNCNFEPHKQIIVGNVVLYGATSGEAYFRGVAGERFCVRNSGAHTVVEGVGDHGCEYMTGGRVVILGPTGRNFGAGMSGGIAYVYDTQDQLKQNCNLEMIELENELDQDDIETIKRLVNNHFNYTESQFAKKIMAKFSQEIKNFIKVMPIDYKKALIEIRKKMKEEGISEREAMYGT